MSDIKTFDWDEEIDLGAYAGNTQEKEAFVVLTNGKYPFRVHKIEKSVFNGSDKLPQCNMVKVGCIIDGGSQGHSYVTTRFYMCSSTLFKILQFMASLGIPTERDGKTVIPWSKVEEGMTGTCEVSTRTWTGNNGPQTQNEVKRWIKPSAAVADTEGDEW